MRPREAAVMPLPREEVTPPVTNTNFGTGWTSGVFSMIQDVFERRAMCYALRSPCPCSRGARPPALSVSRGEAERLIRSGDGEGKAVQNDEAGSIACGVRRIGRDLYRLITAAIVEVSIESQTAESRIAELTVLEPGVLDDRDKTRS